VAVQYFLKIEGIPGNCANAQYRDWIQVESFLFVETQPTGRFVESVGGLNGGRIDMQDLVVVMNSGKATPKLLEACASGRHIPQVLLECFNDEGEHLRWVFSEVVISSCQIRGASGSGPLAADQASFNFALINLTYVDKRSDDGEVRGGWDLRTGRPAS
jgi:type VI secretion system secreted protein Hcp